MTKTVEELKQELKERVIKHNTNIEYETERFLEIDGRWIHVTLSYNSSNDTWLLTLNDVKSGEQVSETFQNLTEVKAFYSQL